MWYKRKGWCVAKVLSEVGEEDEGNRSTGAGSKIVVLKNLP
jgi:hypothetical protein